MDPPPTATPHPNPTPTTSPRPPIPTTKLRLMCSYGGHIVPRPHDKSLFYASGETRIVAVDRRSTAASLQSLTSHLSRAVFHNRPFHLKYQLPDEDLDSLISVITDEDLANMLEEHDRVIPPARIRLFLFPVRPESLDSALLDPKSESWFSDALKGTGILQKGQSADCGLFMGLGSDLESGGGGEGGKVGAESVVLETNSSFGSTCSSFSMSNSPPIGIVNCEDKGLNLLERKIRVPSSASIESENSVGSLSTAPKPEISQEPLIQIAQETSENPISDHTSFSIPTQKPVQVLGYPLDGKNPQPEPHLIQGGVQYIPQYTGSPMPISQYYPVYQMPIHPQHIPGPPNQPYPVYLMPIRQSQYHNMPMQFNSSIETNSASRPPLPVAHKEVFGVNQVANQGPLVMGQPEAQIQSEPVTSSEFEEDIAYNQIYKSQPSAPVLPTQYHTMMLPEPSVQIHPNNAKQQAPLHPQ